MGFRELRISSGSLKSCISNLLSRMEDGEKITEIRGTDVGDKATLLVTISIKGE